MWLLGGKILELGHERLLLWLLRLLDLRVCGRGRGQLGLHLLHVAHHVLGLQQQRLRHLGGEHAGARGGGGHRHLARAGEQARVRGGPARGHVSGPTGGGGGGPARGGGDGPAGVGAGNPGDGARNVRGFGFGWGLARGGGLVLLVAGGGAGAGGSHAG